MGWWRKREPRPAQRRRRKGKRPIRHTLSAAVLQVVLVASLLPTVGAAGTRSAVTAVTGALAHVVINPSSDTAFATNTSSNEVEVISLATGQLQSPIPVGSHPNGLALNADGSRLYVANTGGSDVSVVDVTARRELHRILVPPNTSDSNHPFSIAVANNGRALMSTTFAGIGAGGQLMQIDLTTEVVTQRTDFGGAGGATSPQTYLAASGDHSSVGVVRGNESAGAAFLYNAATNTFSPERDTGWYVKYVALDQTGSTMLVNDGDVFKANLRLAGTIAGVAGPLALDATGTKGYRVKESSVDALDVTRFLPSGTIPLPESVGGASGSVALSPDGATLVVLTATGMSVVRVADQVGVPRPPGVLSHVVIDPSSTHAFVSDTGLNQVDVVALATGKQEAPIPVGSAPYALDLTPDGSRLLVANSGGSDFSVVDVASRREVRRITLPPNTSTRQDDGPVSIAVTNNGLALMTTDFTTSNLSARIFQVDTTTDVATLRSDFGVPNSVSEGSVLVASGDRSAALLAQGGGLSRYDAQTNTFSRAKSVGLTTRYLALDSTGSTTLGGDGLVLDRNLAVRGSIKSRGPGVPDGTTAAGVALNAAGTLGYRVEASTIDVIDTARFLPVASITLPEPVGGDSGAVALSPDGATLAVLTDTGVSVVRVADQVPIPAPLEALNEVVIDPSSTHVFATDSARNQVDVLSLVTGRYEAPILVGSQPKGIALTPDGSRLYVANSGAADVSVIDVAARREIHRIAVPPPDRAIDYPYSLAVAGNGLAFLTTTFYGSGNGARIMQLDLGTEVFTLRTDFVGYGVITEGSHVVASGDHSKVAVLIGDGSGRVFVYDTGTDRFSAGVDVHLYVQRIAINRTGSTIEVGPGTILLDGSPKLTGSIMGGGTGVALTGSGAVGYRVQDRTVDTLDIVNQRTTGGIALPEPVGAGSGNIALSPDERTLAVITATGISLVSVRAPVAGVVGGDGALYTTSLPQTFQSLGGALIAAPAIVSVPSATGVPTPLYIAVSGDHSLYVRSDSQPWRHLVNSGCWDSPAALVTADGSGGNTLTVACEGGDRGLYYWQTPVTSAALPMITTPSTPLAGLLAAGPAVGVVGGRITFVAIGIDNHAYSRAVGDPAYVPLPAACYGHPAVSGNATTAYMACQGLDGQLYYSANSGSGWQAFRSAGGRIIDGPGMAVTTAGAVIYVEGIDGKLYHTVESLDGAASAPFVADGGGIHFGAAASGLD